MLLFMTSFIIRSKELPAKISELDIDLFPGCRMSRDFSPIKMGLTQRSKVPAVQYVHKFYYQEQGITRENFRVGYRFEPPEINDNTATIKALIFASYTRYFPIKLCIFRKRVNGFKISFKLR